MLSKLTLHSQKLSPNAVFRQTLGIKSVRESLAPVLPNTTQLQQALIGHKHLTRPSPHTHDWASQPILHIPMRSWVDLTQSPHYQSVERVGDLEIIVYENKKYTLFRDDQNQVVSILQGYAPLAAPDLFLQHTINLAWAGQTDQYHQFKPVMTRVGDEDLVFIDLQPWEEGPNFITLPGRPFISMENRDTQTDPIAIRSSRPSTPPPREINDQRMFVFPWNVEDGYAEYYCACVMPKGNNLLRPPSEVHLNGYPIASIPSISAEIWTQASERLGFESNSPMPEHTLSYLPVPNNRDFLYNHRLWEYRFTDGQVFRISTSIDGTLRFVPPLNPQNIAELTQLPAKVIKQLGALKGPFAGIDKWVSGSLGRIMSGRERHQVSELADRIQTTTKHIDLLVDRFRMEWDLEHTSGHVQKSLEELLQYAREYLELRQELITRCGSLDRVIMESMARWQRANPGSNLGVRMFGVQGFMANPHEYLLERIETGTNIYGRQIHPHRETILTSFRELIEQAEIISKQRQDQFQVMQTYIQQCLTALGKIETLAGRIWDVLS